MLELVLQWLYMFEKDHIKVMNFIRTLSASDLEEYESALHRVSYLTDLLKTYQQRELDLEWVRKASSELRNGFVYLLDLGGGLYKIGRSDVPYARLKTMRKEGIIPAIGTPGKMDLVHLLSTGDMVQAETELHVKYGDQRVDGVPSREIFALSLEHVRSFCEKDNYQTHREQKILQIAMERE